jgi:hypothetical protein
MPVEGLVLLIGARVGGALRLTGACCVGALAWGVGAGLDGLEELLVLLCCAAAKRVRLTRASDKAKLRTGFPVLPNESMTSS